MSIVNKTPKLRAFIGCTTEQQKIARALQDELSSSDWCYPELWRHGFFGLSLTNIENLEQHLPHFDIAIFLLTPDDITRIRHKEKPTPRDNLVFEAGLSMGILGRHRTFLVVPKGSDLRLPTDLLGMTNAEYDGEHPNPKASMAGVCDQIHDALTHISLEPADLLRSHFSTVINSIHPHHCGEFESILGVVRKLIFGQGVIRRNWTVDISYDFKKLDENIITEHMVWDYELINVTREPRDYPLPVYCLAEGVDNLISVKRVEKDGTRTELLTGSPAEEPSASRYVKRVRRIPLSPGDPYIISLRYIADHPVSPDAHWIYNALAPIQPTLSARIKARIPEGYEMSVIGEEIVEPEILSDHWDFRFPGPLLPQQIIEYMFCKKGWPS